MTTTNNARAGTLAPMTDRAVRDACAAVKYAAADEMDRFDMRGVYVRQEATGARFIASDGKRLAAVFIPGAQAPAAFFPLESLIGSGKRKTNGMPKAGEPKSDGAAPLFKIYDELAEAAAPEFTAPAEDFRAAARHVYGARVKVVTMDVLDGVAVLSGRDDVVDVSTDFDVDPRADFFQRREVVAEFLTDAAKRIDSHSVRIASIGEFNAEGNAVRGPVPSVRIVAGNLTAIICARKPEPKGGRS